MRKVLIILICSSLFMMTSCKQASEKNSKSQNNKPQIMKMKSKVVGKGSAIVLVPGGLTGWASWEPFVNSFAEKHTVVRVQLLSVQYGLENKPLPVNYTVKTESEALAATLDSLGYDKPVDIVSWSFGAFTALQYALDHPERIRTLTLIEPPALWALRAKGELDEKMQKTVDFLQTLQGDITEDMLAEFLLHAGFIVPGQSARELPQWNNWVPFRQSLRNSPSVCSYRDDLKRLRNFEVPTFLVKGTGSSPWLHQVIDVLQDNIPNTKLIELPGGHAPHIVSKEKFLEVLEKFQQMN